MATHASDPRRGITQTSHRPRHRPGSRGTRNALIVAGLGLVVAIAGLADPKVDGPAAAVIGVVIIVVGMGMLIRSLPGAAQTQVPPAQLLSTPEGIVLEGETLDTTVPWDQYRRLTGTLRGSTLEVCLERTDGGPMPVTALSRRSLRTGAARTRALAEIAALDVKLRGDQSVATAAAQR